MRILILSKSLHRGGGQAHILMIAQKLKEFGNFVIVGSDNLLEKDRFEERGIPVAHLRFMSHNPIVLIKTIGELKRVIVENNIEIVHCHWNITSLFREILNRTGFKIPFVWSQLQLLKPSVIKRWLFFYGKKAIVFTKTSIDNLTNDFRVPKGDIEEVTLGIDFEKYDHNDPGISELKDRLKISDEFVITMLCRFDPTKNHKCTIEALNILVNQKNIDNIKCIICGKGSAEYEEEIRSLVKKYNLENIVIFAGFTEPVSTLGLTGVMVLPSKTDGYAVSCLEAFAMKVPVIRTKAGAYFDMTDLCIGFDVDNYQELADSIESIIKSNDKNSEMIERAYEYTKNNCTNTSMTKSIEAIYEKVLQGK